MYYIAADFGAGSGRVIVGKLENGELDIHEIHRFPNRQINLGGRVYWDFLSLYEELKTGLKKAFAKYGSQIKSIGIDTWGVDYGLLDKKGRLLSNPVCYRDSRTQGMLEKAFERLPKEKFFSLAGNQFMEINTVFQLYSAVSEGDESLKNAEKLLFMPDLFAYFLTGKAINEYTISSTSQMLNSQSREWDDTIFKSLSLPKKIMQEVVYPGTKIGDLTESLQKELGGNADVVAVGSHDTASALAAITADDDEWAFISSGTWSLMGMVTPTPLQTPEVLASDFTNEGAVSGEIRLLKNITGLWLIQSLVKEWSEQGQDCDYSQLVIDAETSSCESVIDVSDSRFTAPQSMAEAICDYCAETKQNLPRTQGDYMRLVCQSLATEYAKVKQELEQSLGRKIKTIYIVGGGSQNGLLNKMTAQKTGCKVIAGPVEATAIGNIKVQAQASGELSKDKPLRLKGNGMELKTFLP